MEDGIQKYLAQLEATKVEIERNNLFLKHWELDVVSYENRSWESSLQAIEFGKIGIRSNLLLNGGALVVYPAFLTALQKHYFIDFSKLTIALGSFGFGLAVCAASIVFAYFSLSNGATRLWAIREIQAVRAKQEEETEEGKKIIKEKQKTEARHTRRGRIHEFVALGLLVASLLSFCAGTYFGVDSLSSKITTVWQ